VTGTVADVLTFPLEPVATPETDSAAREPREAAEVEGRNCRQAAVSQLFQTQAGFPYGRGPGLFRVLGL